MLKSNRLGANPIAVKVSTLRGQKFRDHLAFGDILPHLSARPSLKAAGVALLSLAFLLLPSSLRRTKGSHESSVLLIAAPYDDRSCRRIEKIAEGLRARGWIVEVAHRSPRYLDLTGTSPRACFKSLYLSPVMVCQLLKYVTSLVAGFDVLRFIVLARWICIQRARVQRLQKEMFACRPLLVVVDYDRGLTGAPFVLAASNCGIRTVSLVHGDPNPVTYSPQLADVLLFWSRRQLQNFESWDERNRGGVVVGCFWRNAAPAAIGEASKRNALFVHSGVAAPSEYLLKMLPLIREAEEKEYSVRVRFHPMAREVPRSNLTSTCSLVADLTWASHIFTDGSTTALDALLMNPQAKVVMPMDAGLELASLADVALDPLGEFSGTWGSIPDDVREDQWPFKLLGDSALNSYLDAIEKEIYSV